MSLPVSDFLINALDRTWVFDDIGNPCFPTLGILMLSSSNVINQQTKVPALCLDTEDVSLPVVKAGTNVGNNSEASFRDDVNPGVFKDHRHCTASSKKSCHDGKAWTSPRASRDPKPGP